MRRIISLLLLSPAVLVAVFMMVSGFPEPSVAPCTPAPATFATWVVCNTATARALTPTLTPRVVAQTHTPQATQTPAPTIRTQTPAPAVTPTRIEPQRMYCRAGSVTQVPVEPNRTLIICQEWTP